jgi:DNA-directed RNA polymerase specialized sigma24 family protein
VSAPARRPGPFEELVQGVLAAKPEAFEHFFEAWLPPVLRYARHRRPSEAAAQELTRRILRRAVEELPGWRPGVDLAAWMLAVAEVVLREDDGL